MSPGGPRGSGSGRRTRGGRPGTAGEHDLNTLPGAVGILLAGSVLLYLVATFIRALLPLLGPLLALSVFGIALAWLGDRL